MSANRAKLGQRERLLAAMTLLAGSVGYAEVSIADLTSRAGVSRQTFYELFADKDECFRAAYLLAARRVLGPLRGALERSDWWETPREAIQTVLEQIDDDPETSWFFFVESLAAGARIEAERSRALGAFESHTEAFLDRAPAGGLTLDIPPRALLGAIRTGTIRRVAALHSHINAPTRTPELMDELVAWIRSYAIPAGRPRWSSGPAALLPARPAADVAPATSPILRRPEPLPRGRHRLPRAVVARNQRERILHATAEMTQAKGYVAATVGDIVLAAGIGRDVFYEHFTDKRHAFLATQQRAVQETFRACAHTFFSHQAWPQRVYGCLRTLTLVMAREPAMAHLCVVEPYAAGAQAIDLALQMTGLYAVFLEEGYRHPPQAAELPRLCSSAIVDAVFEIIRGHLTAGRASELPRGVPQLAYIAIAPFVGAQAAAELIEGLAARPSFREQ
ncbi:MAG TPA: TetR/AcrR family transcriptional regulator [Solirubrobacteraceae bacterium]|nr:TetR/AcrR family transcriptional regulator [Solirubrobacteraceae bacterium]